MRISDWSSDVCSSDLPSRVGIPTNPRRDDGITSRDASGGPEMPNCMGVQLTLGNPVLRFRLAVVRSHHRGPPICRQRCDAAGTEKSCDELGEARWARYGQIGRAHVCTPVTNAHLVCRLLLEKKNKQQVAVIQKA